MQAHIQPPKTNKHILFGGGSYYGNVPLDTNKMDNPPLGCSLRFDYGPLGRALARKSINTLEKTEHKHGSYRTQCVCCTGSKAECLWISHLACANAPQTVNNSI